MWEKQKRIWHCFFCSRSVIPLAPEPPKKEQVPDCYYVYGSYLRTVFKNFSLKNIALTGDYGIGKSRFLNWYCRNKKYLFVSLGSFDESDKEKGSLECNLIQQILSGCKFGEMYRVRNWGIYFASLFVCIFVAFSTLSDNYVELLNILKIETERYSQESAHIVQLCMSLLMGVMCVLIIPFIIKWGVSSFSLRKISVHLEQLQSDIEIAKVDDAPSVMDRYRMELVEIIKRFSFRFGHTIIFEDMDRLEDTKGIALFTQLREINHMVNLPQHRFQSKRSRAKKTIRFIYVLHDGFFHAGTKDSLDEKIKQNSQSEQYDLYQLHYLKFFDYILPFMPQMYRDASAKFMSDRLSLAGFQKNKDELIQILGKEIDDYRVIQNIINEFCVIRDVYEYERGGNYSKEDDKHIMALAVYKTLMPEDYHLIRNGKSMLQGKGKTYGCLNLLVNRGWLSDYCLRYAGLKESEIKEFAKNVFYNENVDEKKESILWLLNEWYPVCRELLKGDSFCDIKKIIETFGYSILAAELKYDQDNLIKLSYLSQNYNGIRINEEYTDEIKNSVMTYVVDKKNTNVTVDVSVVLRYLITFCETDTLVLDCLEAVPLQYFFECYLELPGYVKEKMIDRGIMDCWMQKVQNDPIACQDIQNKLITLYRERKRFKDRGLDFV